MLLRNLGKDFIGGWFLGCFEKSIVPVSDKFEVGVKYYKRGDTERRHVHTWCEEITVVVSGEFRMGPLLLRQGDVVHLGIGEPMPGDWICSEDGATAVVKIPSVPGDKRFI